MKKICIILLILTVSFGIWAESGVNESGLGISYAGFAMENPAGDKVTYSGYGLETYVNTRMGHFLGIGSNANYYYFSELTIGNITGTIDSSATVLGLSALFGPSIELNMGPLGALIMVGPTMAMHALFGETDSYLHLNLGYGADAKAFLALSRSLKLYAGVGFTNEVKTLTTDYSDEPVLTSAHATLGLHFVR